MRRKSLVVKTKANKNKLIFIDQKILNFYTKFKSILFNSIKKKNFAVAVSGGSDSLCLAYFAKRYSFEFNTKMHVLIVDHKLRKESSKEASKVKKLLSKKKILSKILKWKGEIPSKNIQKNARDMRYALLSKYCIENKVKYLVTAHHGDDQIENFFIRLIRGSGLTGLSSNYFRTYIEDPSNKNERFLRVRIRKYRKNMEKEGLDTNKIIKTVDNLFSANQALDFYKNKALYKHASFLSKNKCLISENIFSEEAGEIIFKSFSDVISLISGTYYPPRSKKVINLINRLKNNNFTKCTLGGCIIEKKGSSILILKELRIRKISYQLRK